MMIESGEEELYPPVGKANISVPSTEEIKSKARRGSYTNQRTRPHSAGDFKAKRRHRSRR